MKKGYSILISLLITLFICITIYSPKGPSLEDVVVKRIIDGDTLVSIDDRIFRLANINSPEKDSFKYLDSLSYLSKFANKTIQVEVISLDNSQRREVARIYYDGEYINLKMVEIGLTPKAWVDQKELKIFALAEEKAVNEALGIWEKSPYSGCLNISLDKYNEEISLKKLCKLNLTGWTLRDESRELFVLPKDGDNFIIKSGNFSKSNNPKVLYWKTQNIWNNDRDSIYIFDSNNKIAYYYNYGYY